MTVISVVPDPEAHTLTLTAEYSAPVERVWELWADPRLLERWWGPPTYPATVLDHDLSPDGRVTYYMTGPEGDKHAGWWRIVALTAPTELEFDDLFGEPDVPSDLPVTHTRVAITDTGNGRTRMVLSSSFASAEAMKQLIDMGMLEGFRAAVGQTDALLAEAALH